MKDPAMNTPQTPDTAMNGFCLAKCKSVKHETTDSSSEKKPSSPACPVDTLPPPLPAGSDETPPPPVRKTEGEEPEWSEGDGLIARLLKSPVRFLSELKEEPQGESSGRRLPSLLLLSVVGYALFGLAAGSFGGFLSAGLGALKGACVALSAYLLCFPALFVFSCASGTTLPLRRIAELGASCTATAGLLFASLAPVEWLFAVSSASLAFIAILSVACIGVVAAFAFRIVTSAQRCGIVRTRQDDKFLRGGTGLHLWFAILVVVSLQTLTILRPILSAPDASDGSRPKMFFVEHFFSTLANN